MTPPHVAVVLCTRDRPALLESAAEAIVQGIRPVDEAVVVDSASRDPAVARIARAAGLRVVRAGLPGASRARNLGAASTTAPLIAFTDDDCLVAPGWTEAVEASFVNPAVGFVTGRVVADAASGEGVALLPSEEPQTYLTGEDPGSMGHGANMAFRRTAFEEIDGFDEVLGAGAPLHSSEDKDAFWRVLRSGWTGRYEPSATLVHRQWRSRGAILRLEFHYGIGAGALAVKALRERDPLGRRMLLARTWEDGVLQAWRDLRAGYEVGAARSLLRGAGAVAGSVRGALRPIREGRFTT